MRYGTLCENHLFGKVFKAKKRVGGRTLAVYCLKDLHAARLKKENPRKEKINRVGISVTKKLGCAVRRNRAKRIIREAYREINREREIKKGYLIVISPKESIAGKKTQDVKSDLLFCLEGLGLLQ